MNNRIEKLWHDPKIENYRNENRLWHKRVAKYFCEAGNVPILDLGGSYIDSHYIISHYTIFVCYNFLHACCKKE
jgi:hypothetical protein